MLDRISQIYKKLSHAAMRSGREADAASIIAVSKTMPAGAVQEAYEAGLRRFGESKVQEAIAKAEELKDLNIEWHLVGHLQRNKARQAVGFFRLIHSVDSAALLKEIEKQAAKLDMVQSVLLQVKLADEATKSGAAAEELEALVQAAEAFAHVKVEGLMTIPPFYDDPEAARPYYKQLHKINEKYGFNELSMGMTGDYEVAVEEGATLVRIGAAIFGERACKREIT